MGDRNEPKSIPKGWEKVTIIAYKEMVFHITQILNHTQFSWNTSLSANCKSPVIIEFSFSLAEYSLKRLL